ncbi:hypothetical protein HY990_02025, partial [Candidatus Micrarchaeota archaeon]|nr:hypothetical protein [Candidatus Micrarchaeota archaeon]
MQKTLFDLYRFSVNYGKIFVFAILLLNFASLVSAGPTDGISNLISVLSGLCVSARGLLGVGMMLMI